MALTCTLSAHFKYALGKKLIDLSADSIKVLLMRNGFSFAAGKHLTKLNVKGTITRTDLTFASAGKTITTVGGNFLTAGFVIGNQLTISGSASNNEVASLTIANVSALVITTNEAIVNESDANSITIACSDELGTANGYTQDTMTLTGVTWVEDDVNLWALMSANNVVWTANAGSGIGPTPQAILYDDTSSDKTIVGCIDFGGNQTAPNGAQFTISNEQLKIS